MKSDLKILGANRLTDGEAVWWTGSGWADNMTRAVLMDSATADVALAAALAAETVVVSAEIEDALPSEAGPVPRWRERIRSLGPTVRLDLGKKAEAA